MDISTPWGGEVGLCETVENSIAVLRSGPHPDPREKEAAVVPPQQASFWRVGSCLTVWQESDFSWQHGMLQEMLPTAWATPAKRNKSAIPRLANLAVLEFIP